MDETQIKKLFGQRIKELRKEKKLTQEKLSELIFMDPQHYCKMENGNHLPSLKNIIKLSETLEVNIQDLFKFNNSEEEKLTQKIKYNINKLSTDELKFVNTTINSLLELRNIK